MTISEKNHVTSTVAKPIASSAGPSSRLSRSASRFAGDTSGTSAIEYALIASVIVLGIVTALLNYTNRVRELYESVAQAFTRSI
ncbi:hypothetical protein IPV08_20250 [Methylobacterium sp. SD274]|uniref:Flp family type IVb pilin n=1 Tax=Methylobacterium sp. SD274 TaxID=2782009 RepID=UPI001A95709F|nr:hypothetical protein [Methylobacterium sp. SD274]MBO1022297.1 hypothetical protein [Methylobacterium sp. SD274]